MNRREFLKGAVRTSLAGLAVLTLPTLQANAAPGTPPPTLDRADRVKRIFKGTRDGLVFESLDGGKTWQRIANFGQHCSILKIVQQPSQLYAQVGVRQYSFFVKSADGRVWLTTDSIPAA